MARNYSRCSPDERPGKRAKHRASRASGRKAVDRGRVRRSTDYDGLFAAGKKHRSSRNRFSGRGVRDSGHRPGGNRGLRLARAKGHYMCSVEVPRASTSVRSVLGSISAIDNGSRRRAENDQPCSLPRCRFTHRSSQDCVLGFSAGGHLAVATSVHFDKRLYANVDAVDKERIPPRG